jgi:hypothetical protein
VLKKIALGAAGLLLVGSLSLEFSDRAYANKVDCDKVMSEVGAGKKAGEISKDLSISTSSVYRCKKKAKSGTATEGGSMSAKKHQKAMASSSASPAAAPASR